MRAYRMTAAALLSAGLLSLAGCTESSIPEFEPTAHHTNPVRNESTAAETETPAEMQSEAESETDKRIEAIWALRPVPIPAGGWTDETLLPVVSISGRPAEMPFCLSELLYGYAAAGDNAGYYETYADSFFANDLILHDTALTMLRPFASDTVPESAVPDHLDLGAKWTVTTEEGKDRYPVSVNCVTIGSDFDELAAQIGADEGTDSSGHFRVQCQSESIRIVFSGNNGTVDTIIIHSRNNK